MAHRWSRSSRITLSGMLSVACVGTLTLIAVSIVLSSRRPDQGFSRSLTEEVTAVDPAGPAARAGLQIGDLIVEQDGQPIASASRLYEGKAPGDLVTFLVSRGGQRHLISITLDARSPMTVLRHLEPLLISLCFWAISVVIVCLKPGATEGRVFFLTGQVGAAALAAGEMSSYNVGWAICLFNALLGLLSALLVHFHLLFPVPRPVLRHTALPRYLYGLALVLILPGVLAGPTLPTRSLWYPVWRSVVRTALVLSLLSSVALLLRSYFVDPDPHARRRVRVVTVGTAWAFAPVVLLSILPEMIGGSPLVTYEITFLSLPLIPLAYATAIYKYDLMGIDRVLNRSLVHFSLSFLWAGLYLLLTLALELWLPVTGVLRLLPGALTTLVIALALGSVRQRIQRAVDRLFYGGWYDYRSVVAGVSTALSQVQDESVLVSHLVHRMPTTMGLRGAALFLAGGSGTLDLRDCVGFECPAPANTGLSAGGPLARLLCREARVLEASRVRDELEDALLSEPERDWLENGEVRLWIPFVYNEELRGALLVGRKDPDDFFDAEDLQILGTLAHQAALAAENVTLLESLRRRVEELTMLRGQLEVMHRQSLSSREEERNRLARELHDRVLQEILALNINLRSASRLSVEEPVIERLSHARDGLLRLADETRRICAELRPPALNIMGLADAIRTHTEAQATRWGNVGVVGGFSDASWQCQSELTITLDLDEDRRRLDDDVAIALFRGYQEALTNVERHAAAEHVWVQERLTEETVRLSIRDDGCGFAVPDHLEHLSRQGHFGLLGVYERVAAVGGDVEVESRPGTGTALVIRAPVNGQRRGEHGGELDTGAAG